MTAEIQSFREDLCEIVGEYNNNRTSDHRYASFDYCHNYFHPKNKNNLTKDIEKSCLVLGFYLASWGMYRGSSFILQKSLRHFIPLIEYIDTSPKSAWEIDANNFTDENIQFLLNQYQEIEEVLIQENNASLILVTKIMLGVFGSVPAFDTLFTQTFANIFRGCCGFDRFNEISLQCISHFYVANQPTIKNIRNNTKTFCFQSGEYTELPYTRSKIIDMYGFQKAPRKKAN